jgi:hypothetical protein
VLDDVVRGSSGAQLLFDDDQVADHLPICFDCRRARLVDRTAATDVEARVRPGKEAERVFEK